MMDEQRESSEQLLVLNPLGVGQALWDIIRNISCFMIQAEKQPDGAIEYSSRPISMGHFHGLHEKLCRIVPLAMNGSELLQVGVDLRTLRFASFGNDPVWEDALQITCAEAAQLYVSYIHSAMDFLEHVDMAQLVVSNCGSKRAVRNLHIELVCDHCAFEAAQKAKRTRKPAARPSKKSKAESEPVIIEAPVGTIQFHGIDCRAPEEFRLPLQRALKSAIKALLQELAADLPAKSVADGLLAFPQDPEDIVAGEEGEEVSDDDSETRVSGDEIDPNDENVEVVTLQ